MSLHTALLKIKTKNVVQCAPIYATVYLIKHALLHLSYFVYFFLTLFNPIKSSNKLKGFFMLDISMKIIMYILNLLQIIIKQLTIINSKNMFFWKKEKNKQYNYSKKLTFVKLMHTCQNCHILLERKIKIGGLWYKFLDITKMY